MDTSLTHGLQNKKLALTSIFFTFFVDNLCWSIVFPIFAPYFLDPEHQLFSPDTALGVRTTVLGFFLMAFSLGQFFGSPFLGEYADRHGRKKALAVSIFFTFIGLGLSAWSIKHEILWLLFASRVITGIFASNMSICLACVADLSQDEHAKTKYFGYLSVVTGFSFVIGAFVGGQLSDRSLNASFSPDFPLWLATGLTILNFLFILATFRETAQIDHNVKFDFLEGIHNIQQALKTKKIKRTYSIYFLFLFAWTILFQFTPVLAIERFQFTGSSLGNLAVYMGLSWAIGSGYLNRVLLKRFTHFTILEICLLSFTVLCGAMIVPKHLWGMMLIVGLCAVIGGLSWPLCTSIISNLAPRQIQGKILGMSQSVQSLALAIAPVIGGLAYNAMFGLPFLIAAGASFMAGIIYFTAMREK